MATPNGNEVVPQFGPAPACALVADGNRQRLPLADQHDQALATRHTGVEQVACQHHVVLRHQRNHHGRILRALALVDRRRIGEHQLIELAEAITHVPAIKGDDQLALVLIDPLHDAKIAIVDLAIVIVLDLHDLVARAEGPAKALNARLARRIERLLQLDVQ